MTDLFFRRYLTFHDYYNEKISSHVAPIYYHSGFSHKNKFLHFEPANYSINFKGDFLDAGVLRFYDLNGKLLDSRDMQSLPGSNISVNHLPRGMIIVEYVSGNLRFVERLLLQ